MNKTVIPSMLIYFYNEEIDIHSNTSVTRLVASLINGLKDKVAVTYFSFDEKNKRNGGTLQPVFLTVSKWARIIRRLNNALGFKRTHWFQLKRNAVRKYVQTKKINYDAVLVLGLDDVKEVRNYFPGAKILYWIHNISAICKREYLYNVNEADYFLSPSRTTYHLLLQKLQPAPLTAEFCFTPNWCEPVFEQRDDALINTLKEKHQLSTGARVFIFAGSDLKLKGRFIIEKVIEKLAVASDSEFIFFFAGSNKNKGGYQVGHIRVIDVGLLSPDLLAAYYQLAHFGCFASLGYDHCPLTLLEMVNCDVLPIASDVGSVKEMLGEGYEFLVEEPHAVSNWISIIGKAILLNKEERERNVSCLKEKISQTYTRGAALLVFEDILLFK